ncbi:MAG: outer membrane protein transport protein [Muribaculaceae bacterium]|nr:outer membrane protein transport protein [Muribaculaceae bacterium]
MKKELLTLATIAASVLTTNAQSAIDAFALSRNDMRGTARFMSMGGAFGALGGDLSVLGQNPGGIGVYRSSEVGVTVDFDFQHFSTNTYGDKTTGNQTKVACNNFGYIGSVYTGSDAMPYVNFGATYSRAASFDRVMRGYNSSLSGSFSNFIAGATSANPASGQDGWSQATLTGFDEKYNPYRDSNAPWLSILAYNSYLINPTTNSDGSFADNNTYKGLWQNGSSGYSNFEVVEKGYVDEYNLSFGGNALNTLYWGVAFGITDISYTANAYYAEDIDGARIPNHAGNGVETGTAGYDLDSWKHISGSGFNFKAGIIVRPINELRLGLAVHTPTYYNLTQQSWSQVAFDYSSGYSSTAQTDEGYNYEIDYKLRTPWRLIASAATVLGGQAIVSLDYEYRPYQNMSVRTTNGESYSYMNEDVNDYYQSSNIIRLGAEYRLTRNWSLRAGYAYESTPSTSYARDGRSDIFTEGPQDCGTMPSFSMDKSTTYITAGIGYRYQSFYADLAYVNKNQKAIYQPYTANAYTDTWQSKVSNLDNQLVVSLGVKF